jgi:hypothetical protein
LRCPCCAGLNWQWLYRDFGSFWQQESILSIKHWVSEAPCCESVCGFHEVQANAIKSLWSLPHRSISQDKLPLYLEAFEFACTLKRRGKRLLSSLLGVLLKKKPKSI